MNSLRLTILLISLNLVVLFVLISAYRLSVSPETTVSPAAALSKIEMPVLPVIDEELNSDYVAILEHPLFNEDRLPENIEESDKIAETNQNSDSQNLTLVGIVLLPEVSQVIIRQANREEVRISLGDTLNGWTLKTVTNESAELIKGGKTIELTLERDNNSQQNKRASRLEALRKRYAK